MTKAPSSKGSEGVSLLHQIERFGFPWLARPHHPFRGDARVDYQQPQRSRSSRLYP